MVGQRDGSHAVENLDFFIRFRRRLAWRGTAVLFRHAVPGCFPDSCQNLDFFIWFRSDVWPGQRDGRRLFRHAVPGCFPDSKGSGLLSAPGTVELPARTLIFSFGSGVTFGPGRGTAGGGGAHRGAHRGVTILMSASARSFPLCQSQTNTESCISYYKIIPLLLPITNKHKI